MDLPKDLQEIHRFTHKNTRISVYVKNEGTI